MTKRKDVDWDNEPDLEDDPDLEEPDLEDEEDDEDEGGPRPKVAFKVLLPVIILAFGAGALVGAALGGGQGGTRFGPGGRLLTDTSTPVLQVGDAATSIRGNTIKVYSWEPSIDPPPGAPANQGYSRAEVEWCAGQGQSARAQVIVALFNVETPDANVAPALSQSLGQDDELIDAPLMQVGQGECLRGNVYFQYPKGDELKYIVFAGQQSFKWALPETGSTSPAPATPPSP